MGFFGAGCDVGGFSGAGCEVDGCSGADRDVAGCSVADCNTGGCSVADSDAGSCSVTDSDVGGCSGAGYDGSRLLRAGSCYAAKLFTDPAKRPPALDDYHNLLVLIGNDVGNRLEALHMQIHSKDVITVCRPIR